MDNNHNATEVNDQSREQSVELSNVTKQYIEGAKQGLVLPYEEEFIEKLRDIKHVGLPLSLIALASHNATMKCYDSTRLLIEACSEEAVLVSGDIADFEVRFGKDQASHTWIEDGDWVYDTTRGWKVDKELYYAIEKPQVQLTHTKQECIDFTHELDELDSDFHTDGDCDPFMNIMLIVPGLEERAKNGGFLQSERFLHELQLWKDTFEDYDGLKKQFEQDVLNDEYTLQVAHGMLQAMSSHYTTD